MEAFVCEEFVDRFNNELQIGTVYFIKNVGFMPAEMPMPVALTIQADFIIILNGQTKIYPTGARIVVPQLPRLFMDFGTVHCLRNRMVTGTWYLFSLIPYK